MKTAFFTLSFFFSSCAITNTPGFYNGYKKLSAAEKEKVEMISKPIHLDSLRNTGQIIATNGIDLKDAISNIDSLMIYTWGPHCSAAECIPLSSFRDFCQTKGYQYMVLAEYYDMEIMDAQDPGPYPYFIADHLFYDKYYANKLNMLFMEDLFKGHKLQEQDFYGRFFLISKGKHVKTFHTLPFKDS